MADSAAFVDVTRRVPVTSDRMVLLIRGALITLLALARADAADKSLYTLFDPTPRELMREMNTDRPDKTESPYTVDAGHFQLEMDVVSYTHDRERSRGMTTRVDGWAVAPINLKVGLCNQADFQLLLEPWSYVRTKTRGRRGASARSRHGFGDVTTRLKYNLWGDDGGPTAFAVMPFLKLPTNEDHLGNHDVEGGVIFPLDVELPHGFRTGLMTELDFGEHTAFVDSITVDHEVVGPLEGYVELFSVVSTERDSDWIGTVDLGMIYQMTDDLELDAGVNIGVTDSADDVNPFVGLSWRFDGIRS